MRSRSFAAFSAALCFIASATAQVVVLDGGFDDWQIVTPSVTDPEDAPGAEADLGTIRAVGLPSEVLLHIELGKELNPQALDGRLLVVIDADDSQSTGAERYGHSGADAIVSFPPVGRGGRRGMGSGLEIVGGSSDASPYDVGVAIAPTYASRQFELRIERGGRVGAAPFLLGSQCTIRLVLLDGSGTVTDETEPFVVSLPRFQQRAPHRPRGNPLAKPRDALRVVSWNGERGAMLSNEESAARVIRALDPDVVLLQELIDTTTPAMIVSFLERTTGVRTWTAYVGAGGGNLRCAVASRLPTETLADLQSIPYPRVNNRLVRAAGLGVRYRGRTLALLSVHLKCCGKIGDSSDRKRTTEVQALHGAGRTMIERGAAAGLVVAGDYNLVGSRGPLDTLIDGLDIDGSGLAIANAMRLDGRSNLTWRNPAGAFVPGRLDFATYSDASLVVRGTFVLDTRDLAPGWLRQRGLAPGDTDISDHLPLVVDLAWTENGS